MSDEPAMGEASGNPAEDATQDLSGPLPEPADLLADPQFRARFEQTSAALEAADLVREMRRQALSTSGMRGINQEELAQRVGLSQPRISQIEKGAGRDGISYALLRKIAHACGIEWGHVLREAIAGMAAPEVAEPARAATARPSAGVDVLHVPAEIAGAMAREAAERRSAQTSAQTSAQLPRASPMLRIAKQVYQGRAVRDAAGRQIGTIASVLFDEHGLPQAVRLSGSGMMVACDRLAADPVLGRDFRLTAPVAGAAGRAIPVGLAGHFPLGSAIGDYTFIGGYGAFGEAIDIGDYGVPSFPSTGKD